MEEPLTGIALELAKRNPGIAVTMLALKRQALTIRFKAVI